MVGVCKKRPDFRRARCTFTCAVEGTTSYQESIRDLAVSATACGLLKRGGFKIMRRSASLLFLGNVISKGLGLVREIVTAALFGTGAVVASFRVALTGTLVPINFLTSDALSYAFVPLFHHTARDSKDRARLLVWVVLAMAAVAALIVGLGLWCLATQWIRVLAPGLDAKTTELTTTVLRTMTFGAPLYIISAVMAYVAMANGDFVPMSYRPGVQNVGLISGTAAAFWFGAPTLFSWGFAASYALFFLWILLRGARAGYLALPQSASASQLREITRSFWLAFRPLLPLPFLMQGTIVVERMVASLISLFAVSALDYARFVSETLVSIISVPIGSKGLVELSGRGAAETSAYLRKVISPVLLITVPLSAFITAHPKLVVQAAFARGAFTGPSVTVTAAILLGISVGLWAQVLGYILINALSAQRRSRTVLHILAGSLGANVLFDLLAYRSLGALALGLGNALYGLGLLAGALTALGIWRESIRDSKAILIGGAAYIAVARCVPPLARGLWANLAQVGVVAALFWVLWVAAVPSLRKLFREWVRNHPRR